MRAHVAFFSLISYLPYQITHQFFHRTMRNHLIYLAALLLCISFARIDAAEEASDTSLTFPAFLLEHNTLENPPVQIERRAVWRTGALGWFRMLATRSVKVRQLLLILFVCLRMNPCQRSPRLQNSLFPLFSLHRRVKSCSLSLSKTALSLSLQLSRIR